jgi:2,4-dienoyl-CoA reductase-like NADH-dependent reductase (Old Yellow Enzyme family)
MKKYKEIFQVIKNNVMKQTAVTWLLNIIETKNGKEFSSYYSEFIEQAKEMEKEQIIDAYQAGDGDAYNLEETKTWAEQYYNETFKSE